MVLLNRQRYSNTKVSCLDINLEWCHHDLFSNTDQHLHVLPSNCSPSQHAIRHCIHCQHPHCRLWYTIHFKSMGLYRCMLRARSAWWIAHVFCPEVKSCGATHWDLSGQCHHGNPHCYLPVDCVKRCWTHQACRFHGTHHRKLQRRQHHWTANLSSPRRASIQASQDHGRSYPGCSGIDRGHSLCLLCRGQQAEECCPIFHGISRSE